MGKICVALFLLSGRALSSDVTLISSADGTTVQVDPNMKVKLVFSLDAAALSATLGSGEHLEARLYCSGGWFGKEITPSSTEATLSVAGMWPDHLTNFGNDPACSWTIDRVWGSGSHATLHPARSMRLHFLLPDLALSVDPDFESVWPKSIVVKNSGGFKSEPTFASVKVALLQSENPDIQANCHARFGDFTREVLPLDPGAKKELPTSQPISVPPQGKIEASALGKIGPVAANLQPTKTPRPVKQVVVCRFKIDVALGTDTNKYDANLQNNQLTRTVRVDVPLN